MVKNPELAEKIGLDRLKNIAGAGGGFGPVRIIYIYIFITNLHVCFFCLTLLLLHVYTFACLTLLFSFTYLTDIYFL